MKADSSLRVCPFCVLLMYNKQARRYNDTMYSIGDSKEMKSEKDALTETGVIENNGKLVGYDGI